MQQILDQKELDALEPGLVIPFTEEEARMAGFFEEKAISWQDALDTAIDAEGVRK
jgi:hypothetical protein